MRCAGKIFELITQWCCRVLQELEHYKGILAERSELQKLRGELQSSRERGDAARQYHLAAVGHLEEKNQALEKERDEMKARIGEHVDKLAQLDSQLKTSEARLSQQ